MIAVTGANGFLGAAFRAYCHSRGLPVRGLVRSNAEHHDDLAEIGDLTETPVPPVVLADCTAVVHCAARAHRMGDRGANAANDYRRVNVEGTRNLIAGMISAGVKRLVFVSSIKACGERSEAKQPLRPEDASHPEDAYGKSKVEAEALSLAFGATGAIEPVVIRPPLIYGPRVKGNLSRLLAAIARGRPLPFASIHNRRSLIGVDNLCDALLVAASHPAVVGNIYHVADDGAISTRRLAEILALGLGVQSHLWPIPGWLLRSAAWLIGKRDLARRLLGDLEIDDSSFRKATGWWPRISTDDGLKGMAEAYAQGVR